MDESQLIKEALQRRRELEIISYALVKDWSLAEDAVQDAFVALYKKQENLPSADKIFSWMKSVVRHKSIDLIRKHSKHRNYEAELIDLVEGSFTRHEDSLHRDKLSLMQNALEDCVKTLNSEESDLLTRFYLKRQKCESIARSLDFSLSAVKKRLSRLRRKLRKCSELRIDAVGESL